MVEGVSQEGVLKVLVLVGKKPVAELIKLTLNHGVCIARDVSDGTEAMTLLREWEPHLAIVEVELVDRQFFEQIGTARASDGVRIPILGLTQRGNLRTKLLAFELGADDIMVIPFAPEEILARVLAITRRTYRQSITIKPLLKLGDLEMDIMNRQVLVGETVLHLTGLEWTLLYFLAANAGQVMTRDQIMDVLWGIDFVSDSNVVDRHIRNLRVKLQNGWKEPRFIATVPGKGYRFVPVHAGSGPE